MTYNDRMRLEYKSLLAFGVKSRYNTLMKRFYISQDMMESQMDELILKKKEYQDKLKEAEECQTTTTQSIEKM